MVQCSPCLMCFLEALLIYFVTELPADHMGMWSHFPRYYTKASWKSVSALGILQFYHYVFRKNWKHDIFPGEQGQGSQNYIFVKVCTVSFIFRFLFSLRRSDFIYHNKNKEDTLEQKWYYCPHTNMALHFPEQNSYNLSLGKRVQILLSHLEGFSELLWILCKNLEAFLWVRMLQRPAVVHGMESP